MNRWFEQATDLERDAQLIARRAYGVIEIENEQLKRICFRPWPKIISTWEVMTWGRRFHRRATGNRCWMYYNQPLRHRRFLSLKYAISTRDSTLRTVRAAALVLDQVARLKKSDAIVCHVSSDRLSDRLLRRAGYEAHLRDSGQRHYIRRFYGTYPSPGSAPELSERRVTV